MTDALTLAELAALWDIPYWKARQRIGHMCANGTARQVGRDGWWAYELAIEPGDAVSEGGHGWQVVSVKKNWTLKVRAHGRGSAQRVAWRCRKVNRLEVGHG